MTAECAMRAMLPRLDAALAREIARLRARYQLSLDEFRGLYVSDAQVDALLQASADALDGNSAVALDDDWRTPVPRAARWQRLVAAFGLSDFDEELLLMAVAPEIDARYPVLYAYLNDDAARRQPTPELAVRLFGTNWAARQAVRERLAPGAPLLAGGLLRRGAAWPEASAGLTAAPVVIAWLLGLDPLAAAGVDVVAAAPDAAGLGAVVEGEGRPLVIIEGGEGSGRAALAAGAAGGRMLVRLVARGEALAEQIDAAVLAARLCNAALLVVADAVDGDAALKRLAGVPLPVFIAVPSASGLARQFAAGPVIVVQPGTPAVAERRARWQAALAAEGVQVPAAAIDTAALRFRLPEARITRAARDVRIANRVAMGGRSKAGTEQLLAAARRQCALDLGGLATQVPTHAGWNDLVMSPGLRRQLRDFAGAVATRDRVFGEWGFGAVGRGAGHGLAALFAGVSGTGKTMSAAVIARETGYDLWRIDLSAAVSKYIGETEKNLDRIFSGARAGNAILFFDEADALFGKRSEVKDAHDRYANIEVAYLLQRLEEHDGIVILASNFSRNIDQAFLRRLHYSIEFAVPDAALRERLWRKALPAAAPLAGDIDFRFLSRQFSFPGGDIRSAALDAAFLAASNGGAVTMEHLVHAVSRQMLKQGKLPMASEFGVYGGMLDSHVGPGS